MKSALDQYTGSESWKTPQALAVHIDMDIRPSYPTRRIQMKFLRQAVVYTLIFMIPQLGILGAAQAAIVTTDQYASALDRESNLDKVRHALSRPELARQLETMGVSPEQARLRVEALTDQELATVADQTDRLPAGGDFFGTIGVIFVILLITDILGFTKVFPFTRAQR